MFTGVYCNWRTNTLTFTQHYFTATLQNHTNPTYLNTHNYTEPEQTYTRCAPNTFAEHENSIIFLNAGMSPAWKRKLGELGHTPRAATGPLANLPEGDA